MIEHKGELFLDHRLFLPDEFTIRQFSLKSLPECFQRYFFRIFCWEKEERVNCLTNHGSVSLLRISRSKLGIHLI